MPSPAATAFCRAVYWSLPVPTLAMSTVTFGYSASKFATTFSRVGSHAQTVMVPPFSSTDWVSAVLPGLFVAGGVSAELQAVRARAATPARAAERRNLRPGFVLMNGPLTCLLYTSDAADDLLCV